MSGIKLQNFTVQIQISYFKVHYVCTVLNLYRVCICDAFETVIYWKKLRKNLLGLGASGTGGVGFLLNRAVLAFS